MMCSFCGMQNCAVHIFRGCNYEGKTFENCELLRILNTKAEFEKFSYEYNNLQNKCCLL